MLRTSILISVIFLLSGVISEGEPSSLDPDTRGEGVLYSGSEKAEHYILASGKKSVYRIAIDPMASESEKWAAVELQHWLKEITGAELPVQDIDDAYSGPQIIIGYNTSIKKKTGADSTCRIR